MKKKNNIKVSYTHHPLPPPPENSIGCGLIYLIASFFHNTSSLEISRKDKDKSFFFSYRGIKEGKNYIK